MATVGNTYLTLADAFKQSDGMGGITSQIIELLAETNPILEDMIVAECNNGTKNLTTIRSGLPQGTWRKLYQGVQPTKSQVTQVEDSTGMLESWVEIDEKLVRLSGDPAQFRLNEAQAFLEGMNNTMAETLFYGDISETPEKFEGLSTRFDAYRDTPNRPVQDVFDQVVDGGGTGSDNTSVWMIVWGETTCHGIYPKGSMAGLQREDLGVETKEKSDGTVYRVFREKFCWDMGLTVRDYRYIVRIANIDVSELRAGNVDIYGLMRSGYWRLYQRKVANGRAAIYCNADVLEALDAGATPTSATSGTVASSLVRLTPMNIDGREVMTYRGIPIRETDAILNTEAAVPAAS